MWTSFRPQYPIGIHGPLEQSLLGSLVLTAPAWEETLSLIGERLQHVLRVLVKLRSDLTPCLFSLHLSLQEELRPWALTTRTLGKQNQKEIKENQAQGK